MLEISLGFKIFYIVFLVLGLICTYEWSQRGNEGGCIIFFSFILSFCPVMNVFVVFTWMCSCI